jgi:hypothetical protein
MNTLNYLQEDTILTGICSVKSKQKVSFASFQKAIMENSELRKQIEDIVDLGLFEYAFRRNTAFIQSVRAKAEAETIQLMMQFVNGADDYQLLKNIIHRNRVIRTLAIKDRRDQRELINKVTHPVK